MFVTSDIFDLKQLSTRFTGWEGWRENLVAGIAVHGPHWPGHQAMADFLLECARVSGVVDKMNVASYFVPGERRSRVIKVGSLQRLIDGKLAGAKTAASVLLEGDQPAPGTRHNTIFFGGSGGRDAGPQPDFIRSDQYSARFVFPLTGDHTASGAKLLELAAGMIGAAYGYYFVRDEICDPTGYCRGSVPLLDYGPRVKDEESDGVAWRNLSRSDRFWSVSPPILRDLYQVNLISERHTGQPLGQLGYLTDWIAAAPGRGQLRDLGGRRLIWSLTDAEVYSVRRLLDEAGLILSCRDRVYRDLPYARQPNAQPTSTAPRIIH